MARTTDSKEIPILIFFSPSQKCKAAGMKTSWVLTEDDKTKIGRRHGSGDLDQPSFSGSGEINIKSEADSEIPNMDPDGEGRIKQRRPSSPMSPSARPSSHHFTNNTGDTFLSGITIKYSFVLSMVI